MKNILIGIGAILIIGGATYSLISRNILKEFFEMGDRPAEQQLSDTTQQNTTDASNGSSDTAGLKEYSPTKEYTAGDTAIKSTPIYQGKVLTQAQMEFKLDTPETVTFRWTPVVPKPQELVMYRLKVWQLMQGQNGSQAMKSNTPIVTKDVTGASEVTVGGIYTGPCRPPYLCDFVWSVEAATAGAMITSPSPATIPDTTEVVTPTIIDSKPAGTR